MRELAALAVTDAQLLEEAGFDAVLLQNSLDRPTRERVDTLALAQLASIAAIVRDSTTIGLGINVLKNDGPAAMAIAAAAGADFVRVKVLTGAVLSAEGVISGCADETLRLRSRACCDAQVWADCYEPTSRSLLPDDFEAAIADALDFGLADAIIVTAPTGSQTLRQARLARDLRPAARIVIGGRVEAGSVAEMLTIADTVIIGSALKSTPGIRGRIDFERAKQLSEAAAAGAPGQTHRE